MLCAQYLVIQEVVRQVKGEEFFSLDRKPHEDRELVCLVYCCLQHLMQVPEPDLGTKEEELGVGNGTCAEI